MTFLISDLRYNNFPLKQYFKILKSVFVMLIRWQIQVSNSINIIIVLIASRKTQRER